MDIVTYSVITETIKSSVELFTENNKQAALAMQQELENKRLQIEAYQAKAQYELEKEKLQRQHDIINELLRLSKHVFDGKIEAYKISFIKTLEYIEKERYLLSMEIKDLEEKRYTNTNLKPIDKCFLGNRIRDLNTHHNILSPSKEKKG
jgi:predicted Holliday junction resolvase-like endonuclease